MDDKRDEEIQIAQTDWQMVNTYQEARFILCDDATWSGQAEAVQSPEQLWASGFTAAAHQPGKCWRDKYKAGTVRPGPLKGCRQHINCCIKPQLGTNSDLSSLYKTFKGCIAG